jgi:hypothetical protein
MDGEVLERAAALVERETATCIESTRIVEQLTTSAGSALVLAVETTGDPYWVVDDTHETACYPREAFQSAEAVLDEYLAQ